MPNSLDTILAFITAQIGHIAEWRVGLLEWYLYLDKAARRRLIHSRNNLRHTGLDESPSSFSEYDNRNLATCQVLLITQIFIGSHKHFKTRSLGLVQKFSVFQFLPPTGAGFRNLVAIDEIAGESARCTVVEKNQHLGASCLCFRAVRRELQNGLNLFPRHAVFVDQLVNAHILEVFEDY
jgi:hypothetical protein